MKGGNKGRKEGKNMRYVEIRIKWEGVNLLCYSVHYKLSHERPDIERLGKKARYNYMLCTQHI